MASRASQMIDRTTRLLMYILDYVQRFCLTSSQKSWGGRGCWKLNMRLKSIVGLCFFLSAAVSVVGEEGRVDIQVVSDGTESATGDMVIADSAKRLILEFEDQKSAPPDIYFFFSDIVPLRLTRQQQMVALAEILSRQKAPVSMSALVEVFRAKRDSIRSFYCEYDVKSDLPELDIGEHMYAFEGSKILLREPRGESRSALESYDGIVVRSVQFRDEISVGASINKDNIQLSAFLRPTVPLFPSMLYDLKRVGGALGLCDLGENANETSWFVYEATRIQNGAECVFVSTTSFDLYLDPNRNFAVVRSDAFEPIYENSDTATIGAFVKRNLISSTQMSEFEDFGNGVWLPKKILITSAVRGPDSKVNVVRAATESKRTISVRRMQINSELGRAFFEDVIPQKTVVADFAEKLTYIHGTKSSLGQSVNEKVRVKNSIGVLLWINGIVILGITFFWLFSQQRKR